MNTYPVLPQALESRESRSTGRQLDRASNGAPKVRVLYSAQKKAFAIVHPYITNAQKTALEAFVAANALADFNFLWDGDGATYVCKFDAPDPDYVRHSASRWTVTVPMVEA